MFENLKTPYGLDQYVIPENLALGAGGLAIFLTAFMVFRVRTLYKILQAEIDENKTKCIPELLKSLAEFAESQLQTARDKSGKLGFLGSAEKRSEVGLFFIGAVEFVVRKESLTSKQRHHMIVQLLQGSLQFSPKEVSKVYSHALATCSNSPKKNVAKFGAKSYKEWSSTSENKAEANLQAVLA